MSGRIKMKITNRAIRRAACLVLVLGMVTGFAVEARAETPKGVNDDGTCTVHHTGWSHNVTSQGISLKTAMHWANGGEGHIWCSRGIKLSSNVDMKSPLIIRVNGKADEPFVLDGGGYALRLKDWDPDKGTDGYSGKGCAIHIRGQNVKITNLKLQGLTSKELNEGKGVHGICVSSDASNAMLGLAGDIPTDLNEMVEGKVSITSFNHGLKLDGVHADIEGVEIVNPYRGIDVNSSNNRLRDVTVTGNTQMGNDYGVVLNGDSNLLFNVGTNSVEKGVYFGENVSGNILFPNCDIKAKKFGLVDESSTDISATNILMLANGIGETEDNYDVLTNNGFIVWSDQVVDIDDVLEDLFLDADSTENVSFEDYAIAKTATNYKKMSVNANGLLSSLREIVPVVTGIKEVAAKKYTVEGFFTKIVSDADAEFDPIDCSQAENVNIVPRLGVFMVEGTAMTFKGAVGKQIGKGIDDDGTFKFTLDVGDVDQEELSGDKFVLVPMSRDWELYGRASNYKALSEGQSDCSVGGTGNNNGNTGGSGEGKVVGYTSVYECNEDIDYTPSESDRDTDSDLDDIPDYVEMSVMWSPADNAWVFNPLQRDCDCDGKLSCWYMTDTDGDGIIDSRDDGTEVNWWAPLAQLDGDELIADRIVVPVNTNGSYAASAYPNAIPDVRDTDSDGDGLWDGEEDRLRKFNMYQKSYLYKYNALNQEPYKCNDVMAECSLSDFENQTGTIVLSQKIGIKYGIYVTKDAEGNCLAEPHEWNMFQDELPQNSDGLYMMACVNKTVAESSSNFNGIYNSGVGETDARSVDTDKDCVCDYHATGCRHVDSLTSPLYGACDAFHGGSSVMDNGLWLDDNCAETPYPTNECAQSCQQNEILEYIMEMQTAYDKEWVKVVSGVPRLVDADSNGVPDLFEVTIEDSDSEFDVTWKRPHWEYVAQICPDFDRDGIPDCVERYDGMCPGDTPSQAWLNPYTKDSDTDGLVDGMTGDSVIGDKEDVCPRTAPTAGQNDEFNPFSTSQYSCDARIDVYASGSIPRILACYLDRDGDGVRDCMEDKDMNGSVAGPVRGIPGIFLSESDPLDLDTDDDGLGDRIEILEGWPFRTNPRLADTDEDGINDPDEDRDGNGLIELVDRNGMMCQGVGMFDTDPRYADTDVDGLSDNVELMGDIMDPDLFRTMLQDATIWADGGISHGSDPNAKDSDNDGLKDGEEYDGLKILFYNSNPCMKDSDGDTKLDKDELPGCRLNKDPNCVGSADTTAAGLDSDSDGLSDLVEMMLGTDPNNFDTDGDGVKDGQEDTNANGVYEPNLGETNALVADTDGDGINDGYELRYGTDPTNIDTDGDCIPDGIEDANHNGQFDMGAETNALSFDTDGDGLPDGWVASSGMGEDLNCNGIRDTDTEGRYLETDPRNPDSDLDGYSDYEEMVHGGRGFNSANISRATTGREGCSMVGSADGSPTSMFYLMGMLLAAVKALAIRRRKASA